MLIPPASKGRQILCPDWLPVQDLQFWARKEKLLLSTLCLFYSRLGERRNRYAMRKVDVFFRDHRVVFDCFVSMLQGLVPR